MSSAFFWGLFLAGLASLLIGCIQVFAPQLADGTLIARSSIPGRAVGNLRQPNHLASLLMWSCVAVVWLAAAGKLRRPWMLPALLFALVFGVVLSASRTGMLGVLLLALWGGLDRKLARRERLALLATPLMLAASWGLLWLWAHMGDGNAFGAESRLAEGAGSPSRLAILANAWTLLKMHPWTGVGWGEFNLAWTMTPFPDRPTAFFDHTHNLPMQLLVELGWPLGLTVLALLAWSLWQAWRASQRAQGEEALLRRCAFMIVLMIGLHSLLEYPLWYAYFLLPTAFALGICLGGAEVKQNPKCNHRDTESPRVPGMGSSVLSVSVPLWLHLCFMRRGWRTAPSKTEMKPPVQGVPWPAPRGGGDACRIDRQAHRHDGPAWGGPALGPQVSSSVDGTPAPWKAEGARRASGWTLPAGLLRGAGALLVLGSIYAVWDYLRVVDIYMPSAGAAPLEQRIARGQRSLFFSTQADYAAATTLPPGPEALAAARRTAHNLIDVRLMIAWAKSLNATGDVDRARYVVARLREFRSKQGDEWLAECEPGLVPEPFQCQPPQRVYSYQEMR